MTCSLCDLPFDLKQGAMTFLNDLPVHPDCYDRWMREQEQLRWEQEQEL